MALVKYCDNTRCRKQLGGSNKPFVQVKQSRSDQIETLDGEVQFRYLTDYGDKDTMYTFCNDDCEQEWKEEQREKKRWVRKN